MSIKRRGQQSVRYKTIIVGESLNVRCLEDLRSYFAHVCYMATEVSENLIPPKLEDYAAEQRRLASCVIMQLDMAIERLYQRKREEQKQRRAREVESQRTVKQRAI